MVSHTELLQLSSPLIIIRSQAASLTPSNRYLQGKKQDFWCHDCNCARLIFHNWSHFRYCYNYFRFQIYKQCNASVQCRQVTGAEQRVRRLWPMCCNSGLVLMQLRGRLRVFHSCCEEVRSYEEVVARRFGVTRKWLRGGSELRGSGDEEVRSYEEVVARISTNTSSKMHPNTRNGVLTKLRGYPRNNNKNLPPLTHCLNRFPHGELRLEDVNYLPTPTLAHTLLRISGGVYEGLHTLDSSADFQINSLSRYLFVPH